MLVMFKMFLNENTILDTETKCKKYMERKIITTFSTAY